MGEFGENRATVVQSKQFYMRAFACKSLAFSRVYFAKFTTVCQFAMQHHLGYNCKSLKIFGIYYVDLK